MMPRDTDLSHAIARLVREQDLELIWANADLRIIGRLGGIIKACPTDALLTDVLLPLHGYQEELELVRAGGDALRLPNLALGSPHSIDGRFNLSVYWLRDRDMFLVHVSRVLSELEFEHRLHQQVRLRQIAEEKIVAQARELQATNAELLRANRDLDQFAYVLSHDLKSPLRALRYMTRDLEDAMAAGDRDAVGRAADALRRQSQRMSLMMSGLYDYARVGRSDDEVEEVDTRKMVEAIIGSLSIRPHFTISIEGDWPVVRMAPAPLDIVLRNLIENASKHHDLESGAICVSARDLGCMLLLTVVDDGPGIPEDAMEAVFEPFVRLEDGDPASGSGMGLTIVKKAVERVGGTIAVSRRQGQSRGVEFKVSWPLHNAVVGHDEAQERVGPKVDQSERA